MRNVETRGALPEQRQPEDEYALRARAEEEAASEHLRELVRKTLQELFSFFLENVEYMRINLLPLAIQSQIAALRDAGYAFQETGGIGEETIGRLQQAVANPTIMQALTDIAVEAILQGVRMDSREQVSGLMGAMLSSIAPVGPEGAEKRATQVTPDMAASRILERAKAGNPDLRVDEVPEVLMKLRELLDGALERSEIDGTAFQNTMVQIGMVLRVQELTEQVRDAIYRLEHDLKVPQLWNGVFILRECERAMGESTSKKGILVFFDFNGFKRFNDQRSYEEADRALIRFGEMLSEYGILSARIGGDEFTSFFPDASDVHEVIALLREIFELAMADIAEQDPRRDDETVPHYTDLSFCAGVVAVDASETGESFSMKFGYDAAVQCMHRAKNPGVKVPFGYAEDAEEIYVAGQKKD